MLTLAIETSSIVGSLALLESSTKVVFDVCWTRQSSHSETVTAVLEENLKKNGLTTADIQQLAVGVGPGSFTGLRVGVNLARALGYALDIPIFEVNSLRILAQPALENQTRPVLALVNAFKNLAYAAYYPDIQSNPDPAAYEISKVERLFDGECLVVGDGFQAFTGLFSKAFQTNLVRDSRFADFPSALVLGQIVTEGKLDLTPKSWREVKPLYIRASSAEEKLRDGLLKPLPKF